MEKLDADIVVVQECEDPERSGNEDYQNWANNYCWIGDTKNKGLGVFAKPEIKIERISWSNKYQDHSVKYFLPVRVNNTFNILGVWAHKNNSPNFGYIGQLWKYLEINKRKIEGTMVLGDLNSNKVWDQWDRWWNHTDVVSELEKLKIFSTYHYYFKESQGEESRPTLFLQRKLEKPYHIDYIFAPDFLLRKMKALEVGKYGEWIEFSDHMPIICELGNFE